MSGDGRLVVEGLTVRYGGNTAVAGVSFAALLGPFWLTQFK